MQTNVNVQGLTVEAALTGRREAVYQAAMLDPHTAAELSLDEIAALVDDLLRSHGDWIPPLADVVELRVSTGQPREDAKIAFDKERRRRALSRLAARMRFEADDVSHMLPFEEVVAALGATSRHAAGEQVIPLDAIVGTVDRRRGDFDRSFRPSPEHARALGADRGGAQARRGDAADRRLPDRRPVLRPGRPPPRLRGPRDGRQGHQRQRRRGADQARRRTASCR